MNWWGCLMKQSLWKSYWAIIGGEEGMGEVLDV